MEVVPAGEDVGDVGRHVGGFLWVLLHLCWGAGKGGEDESHRQRSFMGTIPEFISLCLRKKGVGG